jgi:hypothetical protein
MSYKKARTQHDEISLWLTNSTHHNPAEKKTMSINHIAIISINYTTVPCGWTGANNEANSTLCSSDRTS